MVDKIQDEASSSSSSSRSRGETVVIYYGLGKSSCGYCKSGGNTSLVHRLWAQSITVDDYQELLDHGWRRSGSLLYKPEMERTCCPSYTIRLKAQDFVPSKEQARVSRRMEKFLDGTLNVKKSDQFKNEPNSTEALRFSIQDTSTVNASSSGNCEEKHKSEQYISYLSDKINNAISACIESGEFPSHVQLPKPIVKKVTPQAKKKLIERSGDLSYTSSVAFQISAAFRRSQSAEKDTTQIELLRKGIFKNAQPSELSSNVVAEKLACSLNKEDELSGLSMKACNGHLNFYAAADQIASGEESVAINASRKTPKSGAKHHCVVSNSTPPPPHKRRRIEIRLKRSSFDPEEYDLYRRYQIQVHNDKPDQVRESSYKRFLVDTPLIFVPPSDDRTIPPCGFGSFHQQYVIDGQLVAVGVVDILPRCLSSKYLFWDPDFAFLSLGKYSALQEIGWVKKNQMHCPRLQFYYLGYYIHSCSKMRYKAAYRPSELLCPLRYQWVPFDIAKPLLDKKAYVILSDFAAKQNGASSPNQIAEISTEQPNSDHGQEDQMESPSDEDEEMELDFENSDTACSDDLDAETSSTTSVDEVQALDVSNIIIDWNGSRVKFKDLQRVFGSVEKRHVDLLELQLKRYKKVVGAEFAHRMVYALP